MHAGGTSPADAANAMRHHPSRSTVLFLAFTTFAAACASRSESGESSELEPDITSTSSALGGRAHRGDGLRNEPRRAEDVRVRPDGVSPRASRSSSCCTAAPRTPPPPREDRLERARGQVGFTVVYPEQQTANNPAQCFNWAGEYGIPDNLVRGQGREPLHQADGRQGDRRARLRSEARLRWSASRPAAAPPRSWPRPTPDVFAGGATIAGLPYNVHDHLRRGQRLA